MALDSSFAAAWADLSSVNARLYAQGVTDPSARRAKEALDRATALDPQGVKTHLAAARYQVIIAKNEELANAEVALALQAAPGDAEVLASAASADMRTSNPTRRSPSCNGHARSIHVPSRRCSGSGTCLRSWGARPMPKRPTRPRW